jgi:hypothetical protein
LASDSAADQLALGTFWLEAAITQKSTVDKIATDAKRNALFSWIFLYIQF